MLHQTWLALNRDTQNVGQRFLTMFFGDLFGSLILIYTIKLWLWFAGLGAAAPRRG